MNRLLLKHELVITLVNKSQVLKLCDYFIDMFQVFVDIWCIRGPIFIDKLN